MNDARSSILHACVPTTSSKRKKAESIASSIMILVDLERPMSCAYGPLRSVNVSCRLG